MPIVGGFAASHSPLMLTSYEQADPQQAMAIRNGYEQMQRLIEERKPDVLVVVSNDHFKTFFLDNMPAVCIGIETCKSIGDWTLPSGEIPVDKELSRGIVEDMLTHGFEPAYSVDLTLDHGHVQPLVYVTPEFNIPIVPVVLNAVAPPLPSIRRCYEYGQAIRQAIDRLAPHKRVFVIASGALSHWPPIPKYDTAGDDPDSVRMREIMVHGKTTTVQDDGFRVKRVLDRGAGKVNEAWDRQVLAYLEAGDIAALLNMTYTGIEQVAGNGAQELRNWVTAAGIVGDLRTKVVAYEPIPAWITGMAVVQLC